MASNNEINVYLFKRGNVYYLKSYDPVTGESQYKSSGKRVRRDAEREAGKWQKELMNGTAKTGIRLTWESFRRRYEDEVLPSLAERTQSVRHVIMDKVETHLNPTYLVNIDDSAIVKLRKAMQDEGLSNESVRAYLMHLKAIINWACKRRLIAQKPIIELPRSEAEDSARGRPLTEKEFEKLIESVPEVRKRDADDYKRFIRGLWLSGLRIGEAMRLSWDSSADFSIDLRGEYPSFKIKARGQKSRKAERCPMAPDFAGWLLEQWPPSERAGFVFAPISHRSEKRVINAVSDIGAKAGILVDRQSEKFATAHDLRRSFAARWALKVKPQILQRMMRHSAIETTLKYYARLESDDIAREIWSTEAEA